MYRALPVVSGQHVPYIYNHAFIIINYTYTNGLLGTSQNDVDVHKVIHNISYM